MSMPQRKAVVLLGHGRYNDQPDQKLQVMLAALQATQQYQTVCAAFVEQASPSLPDVLSQLAASGAERIVVVPVYVPSVASLDGWFVRVVQRWLKKYTATDPTLATRFEIIFAPSLAEHETIGKAICELVAQTDTANAERLPCRVILELIRPLGR